MREREGEREREREKQERDHTSPTHTPSTCARGRYARKLPTTHTLVLNREPHPYYMQLCQSSPTRNWIFESSICQTNPRRPSHPTHSLARWEQRFEKCGWRLKRNGHTLSEVKRDNETSGGRASLRRPRLPPGCPSLSHCIDSTSSRTPTRLTSFSI